MTNDEAITNLNMIRVAFVEPVTKEQRKLIDDTFEMAIKALEQQPSDTVSRVAFEQVMWERDVAIEQLKELGYGLGQKVEPCDDLISRDAAIDTIENWLLCNDCNRAERHIMRAIQSVLYDLPSVTQNSETGHWINLEKKYKGQVLPFWGRYGCSKCGGYGEGTFNYCPNCGAKMQESEEV